MKNVLNNFTIRSLKLNIKRTIATCMGIIMSTALICAVAGVFSSFQQTLIKHDASIAQEANRVITIEDGKIVSDVRN